MQVTMQEWKGGGGGGEEASGEGRQKYIDGSGT